LLCKLDRIYGPWQNLDQQELGFSRELAPAVDLDDEDMLMLVREGINVVATGAAGRARVRSGMTMARGSEQQGPHANLAVRRLCLRIVNAIERATRWAVFEQADARLAESIQGQVFAYLSALVDLGAFENDRIDVQCDAGLCKKADGVRHGFSILIAFQPRECGKPISFTLHQSVEGFRVANTAFAPVAKGCA
jgi:phage tail sheath protein FI